MGDTEVQHQRHRTQRIREVASELDVSTLLTPTPNQKVIRSQEHIFVYMVYYESIR
jgi:hypothetical protein